MEEIKLQKRKKKAEKENNKQLLISTCADLANIYTKRGEFNLAIKEYQIIGDVYKKDNNNIEYAKANRSIGEAYMGLHNFEKALEYHNIYLDIAVKEKDELEKQRAFATIGHTYLTWYLETQTLPEVRLDTAYKFFVKSLQIAEKLTVIKKLEKEDMTARLFSNLGLVKECLGEYDKALGLFERSITICKQNDIYEQLCRGYLSIASLYEKTGDYNKSIQNYNFAIDTAKKLKDLDLMTSALQAKSEALIKLADFHSAKQVLLKAYKLKTPNLQERHTIERNLRIVAAMCYTEDKLIVSAGDHKEMKKLYETMGDGACILRNYSKAIEYYQLMLRNAEKSGISNKELGSCYYSLAETYKDNDQYDKAVEYFEKELALCVNLQDSLNTLSKIADTKEEAGDSVKEVKEVYQRAISECQKNRDLKEEKRMIKRCITYLNRNNYLIDVHEFEQKLESLTNDVSGDDSSSSDMESEDSECKPMGADLNLSELTDNSEDSDIENQSSNTKSLSAVGKRKKKNYTFKKNAKGETELHSSCINGNLKLVQHLLEQGHPVNVRDNCGWSPLHEASNHGFVDIVRVLIEKGAIVNDRGGTQCNGVTPLYDAASNGHIEIIELLLDKGASPIILTDDGDTPLNILKKWHNENPLRGEELLLYNSVANRMKEIMEKTGHSTHRTTSIHKVNSFESKQKSSEDSGKKRDRSIALGDLDDEEDEENYVDSTTSDFSEEGVEEYQKVMSNLKRKSSDNGFTKSRSFEKKSAFVNDDEMNDDWLEDDMGSTKTKKRKMNPIDGLNIPTTSCARPKNSRSPRRNVSPLKKTQIARQPSVEYLEPDLDLELERTLIALSASPKKTSPNLQKQPSKTDKKKNQASLLDAGFRRNNSEIIPNQINKNKNPSFRKNFSFEVQRKKQQKMTSFQRQRSFADADSTTPSCQIVEVEDEPDLQQKPSTSSTQVNNSIATPSTGDLMVFVDVRIEGQMFRIPVMLSQVQTNNIGWLAEQASHKYARKYITKPKLELETTSGALLSDEDPLALLFPLGAVQAEPIVGKIIQLSLPPVIDRYKEACKEANIDPHDTLCTLLEEMSISLNLTRSFLPKLLPPLFKCLNHQTTLFELNVSRNFLDINSIKQLCATLPSLTSLTTLNLRCTGLSYAHMAELANIFSGETPILQNLSNLSNLDLSDNNLGNRSLKYLSLITNRLKLTSLGLSNVKFTQNLLGEFLNENLALDLKNLQNLDVGDNDLAATDLQVFVQWTDIAKIRTLNVSRNGLNRREILEGVVQCLKDSGRCGVLENVYLSRCGVEDTELYQLLSLCTSLKTIDLSYNSNLTGISLRRLLEYVNLEHINLISCDNIFKYFDACYGCDLLKDCLTTKEKVIKVSGKFEQYKDHLKELKTMFVEKFQDCTVEEDDGFLLLSKLLNL